MSQPNDLRDCMELPERDGDSDDFVEAIVAGIVDAGIPRDVVEQYITPRWERLPTNHIVAAFLLPTPRHLWSHNPLVRKFRTSGRLRKVKYSGAKLAHDLLKEVDRP